MGEKLSRVSIFLILLFALNFLGAIAGFIPRPSDPRGATMFHGGLAALGVLTAIIGLATAILSATGRVYEPARLGLPVILTGLVVAGLFGAYFAVEYSCYFGHNCL
jgi:hypothetical protein